MSSRKHRRPIEEALKAFCREFTGRDTDWHVETWFHPITGSVEAAVVAPEFGNLGFTEQTSVVIRYLRQHLADEHFVNLGMLTPLTPEEYEEASWVPTYPTISLSVT